MSRSAILDAAMHLAEVEGDTQLSLARLGKALDVDATAMYRHFRDKDDLLLALGDRLIKVAVSEMEPLGHWSDTLESIALQLREVCLARPALSCVIAARFTGGDGELELRDHVLAALSEAGFEGVEAAAQCRAFVEMTLGHIALTATLLSLPAELQEQDVALGLRIYNLAGPSLTRASIRSRPNAARTDEDAVFRVILSHFLSGLRAAAQGHSLPDSTGTTR
ncbi:MAG TPA: helix-turn-helix domain-containing protein [Streptosporangiaceae bacterium]|nr:helix-turn-helix domain-containing protein [Streptosporangiaceae bacterium]